MTSIYKSPEGEHLVRERYQTFLKYWPVPSQQLRVPTRQGETFVVACGDPSAPALLLFHGGAANSVFFAADAKAWSEQFRVYAVDMIGEPGLSAPSRPPLSSDAYSLWLDDVMEGLSLNSASIVGVSLGGWLALDYATRLPERVESLALMCPGGIGRQKLGIVFKAVVLRMCGPWGVRKLREGILGRLSDGAPPAVQKFMEFIALIHQNFRPRMVKMPIFSNDALKRLTMPVMAIVGGKDVLLDSPGTQRRLQQNIPHADVRYLPEGGHFLPGQTKVILEFLLSAKGCLK